jgi:hypothetical protein
MNALCPYIPLMLHSCQFSLSWLSVYSLNNVFKRSAHSVEMFRILFCYFQLDGFVQSYTTALLLSLLYILLLYKIKYLQLVYFISSFLIQRFVLIFSFTQKINSVSMPNSSVLEFEAVKQYVRTQNYIYRIFSSFVL